MYLTIVDFLEKISKISNMAKIGIAFVSALLLPLSIALWSVFAPPLLKGHVDAFIWPFILPI